MEKSAFVFVSVSKGRLLRCKAAVIYGSSESLNELSISFVIIFCLKLQPIFPNAPYLLTNWSTELHSLNESELLMVLNLLLFEVQRAKRDPVSVL